MPHYKDGTVAQVGDVVKGKGYNVRGADGQLKEIVGTVADITPGADSCNVKVAYVEVIDLADECIMRRPDLFAPASGVVVSSRANGETIAVKLSIEYGQTDHFEKLA
jgi:hypothetical protein